MISKLLFVTLSYFILSTFGFAVITINNYQSRDCTGGFIHSSFQKIAQTCIQTGRPIGKVACTDVSATDIFASIDGDCEEFSAIDLFDLVPGLAPPQEFATSFSSTSTSCQDKGSIVAEAWKIGFCVFGGSGFSFQVSGCGPSGEIIKTTFSDDLCQVASKTDFLLPCQNLDANPADGTQRNLCTKSSSNSNGSGSLTTGSTTKTSSSNILELNIVLFIIVLFIQLF